MKRFLTKYAIIIITVLTANLVAELLGPYLLDMAGSRSYQAVLLRMAIIVIIFIPALSFFEVYIKKASKTYLQQTRRSSPNALVGLIAGILVALSALTIAYGYIWYGLQFW